MSLCPRKRAALNKIREGEREMIKKLLYRIVWWLHRRELRKKLLERLAWEEQR